MAKHVPKLLFEAFLAKEASVQQLQIHFSLCSSGGRAGRPVIGGSGPQIAPDEQFGTMHDSLCYQCMKVGVNV